MCEFKLRGGECNQVPFRISFHPNLTSYLSAVSPYAPRSESQLESLEKSVRWADLFSTSDELNPAHMSVYG